MRSCHVGITSCLVLASLAGAAFAADVAQPARAQKAALPTEDSPRMMIAAPGRVDHALASIGEATEMTDLAEQAFDGVLISAEVYTPAGMRVPATRYTFKVTEWIKGAAATQTVTLSSLGTMNANGDGVYTCQSVKLTPGNRYMVFTKPDGSQTNLPFMRVFQVHNNGALVADEQGHVFVGIDGTTPMFRATQSVNSLLYSTTKKTDGAVVAGPIDLNEANEVFQDAEAAIASQGAQPVGQLLSLIREAAAENPTPAKGVQFALAGDEPAPTGPTSYGNRWLGTGYHNSSIAQYLYFPDADNFNWWAAAGNDWNELVTTNATGSDWLIGYFPGAGTSVAPTAGDNKNNCGIPSSAQMTAGGYGSWAANGNPNGICFNWAVGNRITEVDAFVNPTNGNDELQFRKSLVHELGHGLRLGHEDRYVAIMVSGTWRMPPNYVLSSYYTRGDDYRGVRDMLNDANAISAGTWVGTTFGDIATFSQCHPNWGTSGDVQPMMTGLSDYSVTQGSNVTVNNMFVENRGNQVVTDFAIRWYLSTNTTITSADYEVGSGFWTSFSAGGIWNDGDWTLNFGHEIPPGNYYLGWILSGMSTDQETNNNTGIMLNSSSSNFTPRVVTVNCDTSTPAPASVIATNGTYCEKVRVTYSGVANATGYEIYRSARNDTFFATKIADDAASPYDDFTANPRVTYYYWVKAKTNCDVSPFSASNSGNINPVDFNGDGFLTFEDFDDFVTAFEAGKPSTDYNNDGFLTFEDFDAFVVAFQQGC
jgi:hypothetical protein